MLVTYQSRTINFISSLLIHTESFQFSCLLNNVVVQIIIRKLDTTGGIMERIELSYRILFYFKLN